MQKISFDPAASAQPTPSVPSRPSALSPEIGNRAPALIDRECDFVLPRLFAPWREDGKLQEIVRALTDGERSKLEMRRDELIAGLAPFSDAQFGAVEAAIDAMFAGFRSMRSKGDAADAETGISAAVLREYPRWAIEDACFMIARGKAGLDPQWPPNDAQIVEVVERIILSRRKTLKTITALLEAPVATPDRLPAGQRPRISGPIHGAPRDDGHAERVAADLAARRAGKGDAA